MQDFYIVTTDVTQFNAFGEYLKDDRDWGYSDGPQNMLDEWKVNKDLEGLESTGKLYYEMDNSGLGDDFDIPTSKLAFMTWLVSEAYDNKTFNNPLGLWYDSNRGFEAAYGGGHRVTTALYLYFVAGITIPLSGYCYIKPDTPVPPNAVPITQEYIDKYGLKPDGIPYTFIRGGKEYTLPNSYIGTEFYIESDVKDLFLGWHERIESRYKHIRETSEIRYFKDHIPYIIRVGMWPLILAEIPFSNAFTQFRRINSG